MPPIWLTGYYYKTLEFSDTQKTARKISLRIMIWVATLRWSKLPLSKNQGPLEITFSVRLIQRGRVPPDAKEPPDADKCLPDLLGRPSLSYALMSIRNTPKCACVIQEIFLKLLKHKFYMNRKIFKE